VFWNPPHIACNNASAPPPSPLTRVDLRSTRQYFVRSQVWHRRNFSELLLLFIAENHLRVSTDHSGIEDAEESRHGSGCIAKQWMTSCSCPNRRLSGCWWGIKHMKRTQVCNKRKQFQEWKCIFFLFARKCPNSFVGIKFSPICDLRFQWKTYEIRFVLLCIFQNLHIVNRTSTSTRLKRSQLSITWYPCKNLRTYFLALGGFRQIVHT